jgi:hypothetical protein
VQVGEIIKGPAPASESAIPAVASMTDMMAS